MNWFNRGRDIAVVTISVMLGLSEGVGADPFVLPNAVVHTLPRSANGRDYILYVSTPASYSSSPSKTYPVIYACDGYWDFPLLAMNLGNAVVDGAAPECILVGFGYGGTNPDVGTLRTWDLTPGIAPAYDPTGANSGHAQEFLSVVEHEFIPFIEANYRVDTSFRVLTGSSFAGLFTLYALFERPGLFHGYVAPSPSLWWRAHYVLGRAQAWDATGQPLNVRVFTSYATEDISSIISSTRRFGQEVSALRIPLFDFAVREIEGERHSSTKPEAYNRGLRFVFAHRATTPPSRLEPGFESRGTLINLSARARVSGGENVLIGGIIVRGVLPKWLLLRAAGPSLAAFGVAEPLANPRFRIINSQQATVATNDDWGSGTDPVTLEQARLQTGAFAFPNGSLDAATVVSLPPGAYTAVVESVDGTSGVALFEAYEVLLRELGWIPVGSPLATATPEN